MAAWRSGGIPALPFKSALPAAVAPNRSLAAGHFVRFVRSFQRIFYLFSVELAKLQWEKTKKEKTPTHNHEK
jgi:hypothetical protein